MRKLVLSLLTAFISLTALAQQGDGTFKGYLYNKEYQVFLKINFVDNNVVPYGQELFGELPGFFGAKRDPRQWLITKASVTGKKSAKLDIINDYGSEDLTATLSYDGNGTYTLKQESGSRIKIAVNRKWVKIPTSLKFTRANEKD